MDLRSLWRRVSGTGTPADGSASAGAAPGPGSAAPAPGSAAPRSGPDAPARPAWRDLPPIARTVQPAPLVARTVPFSHELSGHQAPPLALETLGHELRADGPAGIVTNLVTPHHGPIEAARSGALRASVRTSGASPDGGHGRETAPGAGPPRLAGTAPNGLASPPRAASAVPTIAPVPRPVVARSAAAATPAANAMVSAAGAVRSPTVGVIGRAQAAGTATSRPAAAPSAAQPAPLQASGAAATPGSTPSSAQPDPSDDGDTIAGPPRRNLGQTRRLRVGAPLDALSTDPRLARRPLGDGSDGAADRHGVAPLPPVRKANAPATPDPELATGSGTGLAGSGDVASATVVARSVGDAGAGSVAGGPGAASLAAVAHPVPSRRVEPAPRAATVPLVGRLAVGSASRSPGSVPRPAAGPSNAAAAQSGPRPASSDPGSGRMSASAVLAALAAGADSTPGRSVSAAVEVGTPISWPVAATTGPAGPSGRFGTDEVQVGTTLVARSFAAGADPNAAPDPSAAAGTLTPLRRLASIGPPIDRSFLPTFAPVRSADAASRSVGGARIVQTSRADEPAPAPSPQASSSSTAPAAGRDDIEVVEAFGFSGSVQRAAEGAPPTRVERILDAASPVVSREDAGGAPGGAATGAPGAGGDDKELDELARKLFPRMQLRLRNELLIDRERIGTLADLGR